MTTSPLRKDIEDLVWGVTDDHYKKISNGVRLMHYGGNWIPISEMPERALEERVRTAKAHRDVATAGNPYVTHEYVSHRDVAKKLHARKVTIYARDTTSMGLGFLNGEKATKFLVSISEYAQHKNAVHLWYVPKGKRNIRELISTAGRHYGRVYLVALDGWNHPTFEAWASLPSGGLAMRGRAVHEITEDIDAYVAKHKSKVLVDLRGHNVVEK